MMTEAEILKAIEECERYIRLMRLNIAEKVMVERSQKVLEEETEKKEKLLARLNLQKAS